jgi:hypothetical protein
MLRSSFRINQPPVTRKTRAVRLTFPAAAHGRADKIAGRAGSAPPHRTQTVFTLTNSRIPKLDSSRP